MEKKVMGLILFPALASILIVMGLWHMDVSLASDGCDVDFGYGLTNGFWQMNPTQTYHLGIYSIMAGLMLLLFGYAYIMDCLLIEEYNR